MKFCKFTFVYNFVLIALLAAAASAQGYEYGKAEELKGKTRYLIDTFADVSLRERMISEISKALPQLVLVEEYAQAEMRIFYKGESETVVAGATATPYGSVTLDTQTLRSGTGMVSVPPRRSPDDGELRIIINYSNQQDNKLERNPAFKFLREFIKTWKKANGVK